MTDKQATDQYWGIVNSGGSILKNMSAGDIQSLIARLEGISGEGSDYAARLREMSSSGKMGDLSSQLTDFQSPLYQQYASYLQKTTPGIGANTLLSPLMAGGTGYAGGQAIVNQKLQGLAGQRQDKINTGVQGFSLGNIGTAAGLLGQQGSLGLGYSNLQSQKDQYAEQNSPWAQIGNVLGMGVGLLNPMSLFSGGSGGAQQAQVAGYRQ